MKEGVRKGILLGMGVIYIALGVLAFSNAFRYSGEYHVLWFCYIGLLLVGIGMVTRNATLLVSQLYIFAIPDLIWTFDFFSYLVWEKSALGIVDYFFLHGPLPAKIVTLQHLLIIPLALYACSQLKAPRSAVWILSCVQVAVLYVLTLFLAPPELNVNCIHRMCLPLPTPSWYSGLWFAGAWGMIFLTRAVLARLPFLWRGR